MNSTGAMDSIVNEIDRALGHGLHYLAIMLSLALPDICAALQAEDGRTSPSKYKSWFDANLSAKFPMLSADDFYSLRCGVVHQARLGIMQRGQQFDKAIFTLPNPGNVVFDSNLINDALQLDVTIFCKVISNVVREWFAAAENDPIVLRNLPNLVQYRPHGLSPYIVGSPLIA